MMSKVEASEQFMHANRKTINLKRTTCTSWKHGQM